MHTNNKTSLKTQLKHMGFVSANQKKPCSSQQNNIPRDRKSQNTLETNAPVHKTDKQKGDTYVLTAFQGQREADRLTHALAQLRIARTHDTKRKRKRNEANITFHGGSHKGALTPLKLRFSKCDV